jgi:hypothetical protein
MLCRKKQLESHLLSVYREFALTPSKACNCAHISSIFAHNHACNEEEAFAKGLQSLTRKGRKYAGAPHSILQFFQLMKFHPNQEHKSLWCAFTNLSRGSVNKLFVNSHGLRFTCCILCEIFCSFPLKRWKQNASYIILCRWELNLIIYFIYVTIFNSASFKRREIWTESHLRVSMDG